MNQFFAPLLDALRDSSLASKLTACLVAMAVVLAVGVSAVVSNKPHYEVLLSGLDDAESAAAMKALAEAGIPFEGSQPPGPFVIYVDRDDRAAAFRAVYLSGEMIPLEKGIPTSSDGMTSVFWSSGQRNQVTQKQLWQEMEQLLEGMEFITNAEVQASTLERSPFSGSAEAERSCAVKIDVRNRMKLHDDQIQSIVMVVSRGLVIPSDKVVLTDQAGRLLHGGEQDAGSDEEIEDTLAYKQRYDRAEAQKVNAALYEILGSHKARVEVDSQWSFQKSTVSKEAVSKGAETSRTTTSTETPLGSAPSGAAGSASNIDFGVDTPEESGGGDAPVAQGPAMSTSSEERSESKPSTEVSQVVNTSPILERLSVALFVDESLPADLVTSLEGAVKATVGFDDVDRKDALSTVQLPFVGAAEPAADGDGETPASPAGEESSEPSGAAEETTAPSPVVELLLQRGVEIAVAVVFIGLLLSSLRGGKKAQLAQVAEAKAAAAAADEPEEEIDPELLAQAQVQDLLSSNPERVGEILSQWARDAKQKVGT